MTVSIPDTLTTDNSGKYVASIRLRPGGLSFSGYIPSAPGSFFYRETGFDKGGTYITSLKEFFFAHEFLTWTYKRIQVIPLSSPYTLTPAALFDEKRKEGFLTFNFSRPEKMCLSNTPEGGQETVVFGMDREIYEFCVRSFVSPSFIHPVTPLLVFGKRQSRISLPRRMYGILHGKTLDILCFERGNILLANTFHVEKPEDIIYYILYVWRQTGMEQEKDELYFSGDAERRSVLTGILHTYLRHIRPVEIPSEAYLLGTEIVRMPVDVVALLVCGL
jgi:hypothetical protein